MEAVAEVTVDAKNVPALRFPEFQGEWVKKKLKDIFTINAGGDVPKENVSEYKTDIFKYPIYANAEKDKGFYAYSDIYKVDKGVVTVAGRGANVGIAHARNHKFYPIVRLLVLAPKSDQNIYFFEYAINRLNILIESTGVPQLTAPQLSSYKVGYPLLPEQQKIASFLSAVDDKIQHLSRKKKLLKQYKTGVMQQIFSQLVRFKDGNGQDFPKWEEKELRDVAKRVTLKNKKNDVSFVLTNSATQGIVSQQNYFDKDIANQENLEGYYVVNVDDFVYNPRISTAAPVGPMKRNKLAKGVMSPLYTVLRFEDQNLGFLEFFFETTVWHRYMKSVANYGARHDRMSITNGNLLRLPIPQPCKEEQQKITAFLSAVDIKLHLATKQLEQALQFKKGLLQKMFV